MRHFLRLTDFSPADVEAIFRLIDELRAGGYAQALRGKTFAAFFPESSLRTRVTFEKGVCALGGQTILFPPATLDKREDLGDVAAYLNHWIDGAAVRHKDINALARLAARADFPVLNAMTDQNHPGEIVSDLYALSRLRPDYRAARYLYVGPKGNIGLGWREAAQCLGLDLAQCCPAAWAMEGVPRFDDVREAVRGRDVILTDSLSAAAREDFGPYRITSEIMARANPGALLNPCPPFFRGEEVSAEVLESAFFVGYGFKKHLLEAQQAVLLYCLGETRWN